MDDSILEKLTIPIIMAEDALSAGNLATAIRRATMALENLPQIEQELLAIRTTAYRRQKKFSEAYNDALILQKKMPNDFRGYAEAALSLFEQEKLSETIETCESILPKHTIKFYKHIPEYKALIKLREESKHKLNQRVDLMKRLPYDIAISILNQLTFNDILNCLDVSKLWRQYILGCETIKVQNVILTDEMMTDYFTRTGSSSPSSLYRAVQLISDQVMSLKINCSESQVEEVANLLHNVSFHHLHSLEVGEDIGKWLPIATLLRNSSRALEQLYLDTSCEITLYEILDICQNIQFVKCGTPLHPVKLSDTKRDKLYLHSTTLTHLHIITKGIRDEDIGHILKGIINLRELMIAEDNPVFLNILYKHGSRNLSHICFRPEGLHKNPSNDEDDVNIDTTQYNRTIDIHYCDNVTADLLLLLLKVQECTEALSLTVAPDILQDWSEVAYFGSFHLRYLKFSFTKETEIVFASMIRNCPSLEQVIIHTISHPPRLLLRAIQSSLPKLRCFAIENSSEYAKGNPNIAIDDDELWTFFQYYVSLGNCSSLQEVRLRNLFNVQLSTLLQLTKLEKLKVIHLIGLYPYFDNPGISPAIRALAASSLPLLEYLVFDGDDIKDYDIQDLDYTVLRLEYLPHVTKVGIEGIMNRSKKLRKLIIHKCEKLDRDVMEDLVAKRKNIRLVYYN
ncbi:hypothetical protein BDC45DRAFT_518878 [Circinella umbellata]|nr:hypothetical protein BDC45DRAFT_518878 [Circinella umbellata]